MLILKDTGIGLLELKCLGNGSTGRNLDDTAVSDGLSVNHKVGTVGVGLVIDQQTVIDILINLRGVGQPEYVVGCSA